MGKVIHGDAVIARVRALALESLSAKDISIKLRMSRGSVCGIAARHDIIFTSKDPTVPRGRSRFWTTERVIELAKLARAGWTSKQLGAHFGRTPGCVRERAKRLGLNVVNPVTALNDNVVRIEERPTQRPPAYDRSKMSLTARLMGDPPPGRTPWAA